VLANGPAESASAGTLLLTEDSWYGEGSKARSSNTVQVGDLASVEVKGTAEALVAHFSTTSGTTDGC